MMHFLNDPVKRGWFAAGVCAVLAIALLAPFVVGRDARHLSAFQSGPEEAGLVRAELEGKAASLEAILGDARVLADVEAPEKTLLVVLGPERRYGEGEARAVVDFLEAGGSVLLADEGGFGTDVARAAGFAFGGQPLLDTRNHLGDPRLVVASATLAGQEYRLLFNAPTCIVPLSDASPHTVVAHSSAASYPDGSYLDTNANGEIDLADAPGPCPLVVRTSVGAGTLVLVADTGLFMDAQVGLLEYRNAAFIGELARELVPRDGLILVDEARHAPPALLAPYDNAVRALGRATGGPLAATVTLLLLVLASAAAWLLTRPTEDWSAHRHSLGDELPVPEDVRPDLERAQRMARRAISEKFNIPMEQVAAMPADQLATLTGDRTLSEAAAGTLKSDPAPLFRQFSPSSALPEAPR